MIVRLRRLCSSNGTHFVAFIRPITVYRHQCQPYDGDSTIVTCGPVEMHVWDICIENDIIDVMEASLSMDAGASLPCASPDGWLRVVCGSLLGYHVWDL